MRVYDNGIYRDATEEEIAQWEAMAKETEEQEQPESLEDIVADLKARAADDDERYVDQEYRLTMLELGVS